MGFSIDDFRTNGLKYGGARPNLFEVELTFPFVSFNKLKYQAKSTFLPATITTSTNINYLGRNFKEPGERTYPQWTVTFINDEDFKLRNELEKWLDYTTGSNKIGMTYVKGYSKTFVDGESVVTTSNLPTTDYIGSAKAIQYSKNGNAIKAYNFVDIYPVTLTDIAMSWDSTNQVEEYSCTFDYQYYETSYDTVNPTESINYNSGSDYYRNNL